MTESVPELRLLLAKIIASLTVPDVELIPHHRKQHRVGAVEELAVFYRVETNVGRDLGGPAAIPACTMAVFRLGHRPVGYLVCSGL